MEFEADDDFVLKAVQTQLPTEEAQLIETAARQLNATVPRLTTDEINAIADTVTQRLMEWHANRIDESQKVRIRERIRSVAYQISLGVAGSAVWSLLAYLAQVFAYADSEHDAELQLRKSMREAKLETLTRRLPSDLQERFRTQTRRGAGYLLSNVIGHEIRTQALAAKALAEVIQVMETRRSREEAQSHSVKTRLLRLLRLAPPASPFPMQVPSEKDIAEEVTTFLFAALKHAADEKAQI
jgi:hypothetical protein